MHVRYASSHMLTEGRGSEGKPQPKLQLPGSLPLGQRGYLPRTGSDAGSFIADGQTRWTIIILHVEDVEAFKPHLQVQSFLDLDALEHREIHVENARTPQRIASIGSKRGDRN